jgi:alkyldihydroxyacetonephosphate synthase
MSPDLIRPADPALADALTTIFPADRLSATIPDRIAYARDLWPMGQFWARQGVFPHPPDAIVWPEAVGEIVALLRLANARRFPVIPMGAGSGVCGGTLAHRGGVILDLKRMKRVRHLDEASLLVTAEAGIIGQHLEEWLNGRGYTLGHFPSSIYCSSFGGWIATRSAGQLSTKYGKIEDMVMGIEGVLPDGTVFASKVSPRTAAGPRLDQLLVGSEGTLAVITAATARVRPVAEARRFAGYVYEDVHAGLEAIRKVMRQGLDPAAVRLYDETDTALSLSALGLDATGCLLVLVFEDVAGLCDVKADLADAICRAGGGRALGPGPGEHWFKHRYDISYKQSHVYQAGMMVDTIEVATTWSNLDRLYDAMRASIGERMTCLAHFSHVYPEGGSIYFTFVGPPGEEGDIETYRSVWNDAMNACVKMGATITHHHGVGLLKAPWMKDEHGPLIEMYHAVKRALDPNNILNPGKLVP